jgi:hypothetical protein
MDTEEQTQSIASDSPLREEWQPHEQEVVWLNVTRRDGKVSTFRVRVLKVHTDDEPAVDVEVFPEFELARPFTYTANLSDIAPLD